jgi:transcriptional regulator with XRE-family HTH domain
MQAQNNSLINTLVMSKYEKIYQDLRKEFSDEEIVSGYVFPDDLDQKEKEEIEEEFRKIRLKALRERTEEQRLLAELMRMKLLMRDYFERGNFEEEFSFSKQLEQYIKIIGRSHKEFAAEIGLHPTKLSRLLNARENPNVELTYRLEIHCGNIIPAIYWWKLHAKRIEEDVRTDDTRRKIESEKVRNRLRFRA